MNPQGERTLYIAAGFQSDSGPFAHFLGDVLTSIRVAFIWVETEKPSKVILSLCEGEHWNVLWARFVRETSATVVYDGKVKHKDDMYWLFDSRRRTREVLGMQFDVYKELYCRMDGGRRQKTLCGREQGLGRRNIFEYFYYGQETHVPDPSGTVSYGVGVMDCWDVPREPRVLIAPYAKCQGNDVFTFAFWRDVLDRVLDAGISVTLNDDQDRLRISHPRCNRRFSTPSEIGPYVARHSLVACGNTGIGWVAGATDTPLMGMEPPFFHMLDYRYREAGVHSVVEIFAEPNPARVANAICEFMERQTGLVDPELPPPRPQIPIQKLLNMVKWLKSAPPGPVVEVGVFEGGSLFYLASQFPDRQFYGFDTFEGHPAVTSIDTHQRAGNFAADFTVVQKALSRLKNVTLVKGRFPHSDAIQPQNIALATVDVNLYESTRDTIDHLIPLMGPQSRLYCNDAWADNCNGATIALCEVAAKHRMHPVFDEGWHSVLRFEG